MRLGLLNPIQCFLSVDCSLLVALHGKHLTQISLADRVARGIQSNGHSRTKKLSVSSGRDLSQILGVQA